MSSDDTEMRYMWTDSPVGPIMLARDDHGIRMIQFGHGRKQSGKPREPMPQWREDRSGFSDEVAQLEAYFAGRLHQFEMTLVPRGTPFQQTCWQALQQIPYATTINYGELARRIGKPSASRAVGAANGANPIGIVIPCHRVIGANGSLTGYGGGIENKACLLAHEQANAEPGVGEPVQFSLQI